jgi:hypothetical protein
MSGFLFDTNIPSETVKPSLQRLNAGPRPPDPDAVESIHPGVALSFPPAHAKSQEAFT